MRLYLVDSPLPENPPASQNYNPNPPLPPSREEERAEARQMAPAPVEGTRDAEIHSAARDQILRFIAGLRTRDVLDDNEAKALEKLLFDDTSMILYAAYSVALSADDASYFAEILKDLASSLLTDGGRLACEAQDEVFQISDKLYCAEKITENQLLYLRHLCLIRDETMATLYDEYQYHLDDNKFALALYEMVTNKVTPGGSGEDHGDSDDEDDDEDDSEDSYDEKTQETEETDDPFGVGAVYPESDPSPMSNATLQGVVSLMLKSNKISAAEARVLIDMIASKNEYVMAAYDLYRHDSDLDELKDTLMRCARLEIRRKIAQQQEDRLDNKILRRDDQEEYESEEESEEEEESSEDGDSEYDQYDDELPSILHSLGVENTWNDTVPARFVSIVFAGAKGKLFSIAQAKALCDLFQARYEFVTAAWEVFTIQEDVGDFVDTLLRVVRDIQLDDGSQISDDNSESTESTVSTVEASTQHITSKDGKRTFKSKEEVIAAVDEAKRKLLSHSLELLTKSNLTTATQAEDLLERAMRGDQLCEAAMEQYAQDRNIKNFLATLRILANNSEESLRKMLDGEEEEEEEEEGEGEDDEEEDDEEDTEAYTDDFEAEEDEEDEETDDENNQSGKMDKAQLDLLGVIANLAEHNVIDDNAKLNLVKLVTTRDMRMMDAYDIYCHYKDTNDLIDTMVRLGKAGPSNRTAAEPEGIEMVPVQKSADKQQSTSTASSAMPPAPPNQPQSLLSVEDMKKIVEILSQNTGMLPAGKPEVLMRLIEKEDPIVLSIFSAYESHKQVPKLTEDLRNIQDGGYSRGAVSDYYDDDFDDDEEDNDVDNDDDDDGDDIGNGGMESVEQRFNTIVKNMQLSELETAALRLAIARNDVGIREALEQFRNNRNDTDLQAKLRSVAGKTIDATLDEAGYRLVNEDVAEDDDNEEDSEGDEKELEVGDEVQVGGEEGPSLTSREAREQIVPILVTELEKESLITSSDSKLLMDLFAANNTVFNAALDVYDLDSDMAELVDTLKRICSLSPQMPRNQ